MLPCSVQPLRRPCIDAKADRASTLGGSELSTYGTCLLCRTVASRRRGVLLGACCGRCRTTRRSARPFGSARQSLRCFHIPGLFFGLGSPDRRRAGGQTAMRLINVYFGCLAWKQSRFREHQKTATQKNSKCVGTHLFDPIVAEFLRYLLRTALRFRRRIRFGQPQLEKMIKLPFCDRYSSRPMMSQGCPPIKREELAFANSRQGGGPCHPEEKIQASTGQRFPADRFKHSIRIVSADGLVPQRCHFPLCEANLLTKKLQSTQLITQNLMPSKQIIGAAHFDHLKPARNY